MSLKEETVPAGSTQPLTYGQNAVGLTFNPGGLAEVNDIKIACAKLIDDLKKVLDKEPTYGVEGDLDMRIYSEKGQLIVQAIREIQTAQMWAVKAITYKN